MVQSESVWLILISDSLNILIHSFWPSLACFRPPNIWGCFFKFLDRLLNILCWHNGNFFKDHNGNFYKGPRAAVEFLPLP